MDLTEMLAQIELDLKVTLETEVTTNLAIRGIQRAVDDLSRHVPRERIYETTWVKDVTDDSFATPSTANAIRVVNAADISATVDGDVLTLATSWLNTPRPLTMVLTDANNSITRMTLIIKGIDGDGVYREERFYRHNGKTQYGKVYFSSIYEVEVNEIAGNGASDTLSIGTILPDAVGSEIWVALSGPVEYQSESIYSGAGKTGTKYTRDTDYEMDYANGRIRMKNGGSMAYSTTYYANYSKHNVSIDISTIIPELIRIVRVQCPVGKTPEQFATFHIWENMLTIGSQLPRESQKSLGDKDHLAVYYETKHAPPTYVSKGSYPEHLDQLVILGASGHILLTLAYQYEFQAATDLTNSRTELGLTTAVHTLLATALAKVATYLETNGTTDNAVDVLANITDDIASLRTAINTALDAANAELDTGDFTDVATHLASSATALGKVSTYLTDNSNEDSKYWLTKITTDIAGLRTAINTALDAANTYLDEVDTTDLGQATVGAEGLLETGDDLINQLNDGGPTVPDKYVAFSQARVAIAQVRSQSALGFTQEASARLNNLLSYIQQAAGWGDIAMGFIQEAEREVAMANQIISRENVKATQAAGYIEESRARVDNLRSYIEEANGWMRMGEIFIQEGQVEINRINAYMEEASRYVAIVEQDMLLSDRFRAEGVTRLNEFRELLRAKSEYRKRLVDVGVRQPK